ncbi:MAG: transferase [Haliangiales bacterium]
MDELVEAVWPTYYVNHSVGMNRWHSVIMKEYADCQIAILDDGDAMLAVVNCLPLYFDGTAGDLPESGWDGLVESGMLAHQRGLAENVMMAMAVSVHKEQKGRRLSYLGLKTMKALGAKRGFQDLYAPVRPSMKSLYPLLPMKDYLQWRRDDGSLFDPWLRVHHKLGAEIIKVCPESMRVETTVESWERDTGVQFKQSGQYVLADALCPIEIDIEADRGTYLEPNVWMHHKIQPVDAELF